MLLEVFLIVVFTATVLSAVAFYVREPLCSILAGIFWFSLAFMSSSLTIYDAPAAAATPITVFAGKGLIYLFMTAGVSLFLHAVYWLMRDSSDEAESMSYLRGLR